MDITIYLPDELGKWAKEHDLPLSRMLRAAAEAEQHRYGAAEFLAEDVAIHRLPVADTDRQGHDADYTARLHGTLIATQHLGNDSDVNIYFGRDRKVYVHDVDGQLDRDVDPEGLREYVDEATYIRAMNALGEEAVIDVGLPE
jgi:hypothetical protein